MDISDRKRTSKVHEYSTVKPHKKVFFLNSDLIRVVHINKSQNFVKIYNISQDKFQSLLWTDFLKHRKRAYTKKQTCELLNRKMVQLDKYIYRGMIEPPTGAAPGGKRAWHYMSYYSEDDIFKIREYMSTIHRGRPRRDGLVTNSVISEQELKIRMGDGIMLYTKNSSGEIVPIWSETI
jgi:hypothetical protein